MSSSRSRLHLVAWLIVSSACAGHRIAHSAPDESIPHISWELRSGPNEGDERSVCESAQPPRNCILPATTEQQKNFATVHLYLHSAAKRTNYVGVVRVPFIEGAAALGGEVTLSVSPGGPPVSRTVSGLVTRRPGSYSMTFALDALVEGQAAPIRVAEDVPVTVR